MTQIRGTKSTPAEVDDRNRLLTFATNQDLAQFLNQEELIFSVFFEVIPLAANNFFFYFKNTGLIELAIGTISISSSVTTQIRYESVTGTPVFVSEVDAGVTNLHIGSQVPLPADAKVDTNITGLTSTGVIAFAEASVVNTKFPTNFQSSILIPQGQAVAFRRVGATGDLTVSVGVAIVDL